MSPDLEHLGTRLVQAARLAAMTHLQVAMQAFEGDEEVRRYRQRLIGGADDAALGALLDPGAVVLTEEALFAATDRGAGLTPAPPSLAPDQGNDH